jgi:hypothetical protein
LMDPDFSQEDRKIGRSWGLEACGTFRHPFVTMRQRASRNPKMLAFARPSDLSIFL